jgi:hypothetical protein
MRIAGRRLLATMLIRKSPSRLLLAAGILSAAALAGLLLLSGWLTSEDSPGLIPPRPEAEGGTIVPPSLTPPPEAPPPEPTFIMMKGRQVPLAPGMTYRLTVGIGDPGGTISDEMWFVTYDSNPAEVGDSWLAFDKSYNLRGSHIRLEDQEEFQPLLDAFASP